MEQVALGVVVLNRVNKLEDLLHSVRNTCVDVVYVADNGHINEQKEKLYETDFPFELELLNLRYDVGLGYSRNEIVKAFDEDYLLIADSDHQIQSGIRTLQSVLKARPDVGGVAGTLIEPEQGQIWQSAKCFYEKDGDLIRTAHMLDEQIEMIDGTPFKEFDFIPYPALYRRECLQDYSWDPEYPLGRAHVDFYIGHWKNTDWKFGVCPNIFFEHFPGGSSDYTNHRRDEQKYRRAKNHFREKWGYGKLKTDRAYWFDTYYDDRTLLDRAYESFQSDGLEKTLRRTVQWMSDNVTFSNK